jgi:GAF domain-containing protein
MFKKPSATFMYTIYGGLFGFLFPVFSTLLDLFIRQLPWTLNSLLYVQSSTPLHWVIDTAPLFLGLFGRLAGRREDRLVQVNQNLEQQAQDLGQTLSQIETLRASLEQTVAERTADLRTAIEVGRAAASILDPDVLASEVVDLVRERFDLYYAGLFLVDESDELAVLAAGTGEAGRAMKARSHALEIGGKSMVGSACAQRQARIALDTGDEPVRFDNPLLPETRSEMALPLIVGDRVLGALDVQSIQPSAFAQEDIAILQLVADQVAVAVENARKFSDEAALVEATNPLFRVSRRMTAAMTTAEVVQGIIDAVAETEADGCAVAELTSLPDGEIETTTFLAHWDRWGASRFPTGVPLSRTSSPFPAEMVTEFWVVEDILRDGQMPGGARQFLSQFGGRAFANIPLRAGNRLIGYVSIQRAKPGPFSSVSIRLYETLADQAAVALERVRLFEEAQRRATREQLVARVTARMRETLDIETVLQTAIREIGAALSLPRIEVRLGEEAAGTGNGHEWVEKGNGYGRLD